MKQIAVLAAVLCSLLFNVATVNAQTTLAAGDIAFTGINSDDNTINGTPADDDFSFIILKPGGVSASTEIYFTDAGWRTDANAFQSLSNVGSCSNPSQSGAVTDGIIKWSTSTALPFGTQVRIRCKFNVSANVGTAVGIQGTYNSTVVAPANPDEYLSLSTGGDQITAYQGTYASPTLLAIINMQTAWGTSLVLCDFCSTCTSLPSALSSYKQLLGTGLDNAAAQYSKISDAIATGTQAGAYAILSNMSNWSFDDGTAYVLPPAPAGCSVTATITSQTNVACNGGSTGAINLTAASGTTPYSYNWGGGVTTEDRTGLTAGTYTVTVTDAASCTATASATLTQPTAINLSSGLQTNVACNGGSNGSAIVTPSGGAGGYSYSWAPSGGTGSLANGLSAGSYTVSVTDANSCQATRTFTITQPPAINLSTGSQTNVACNGGSNGAASVTPSGGAGGYTYSWAPSGGTGSSATGLSAGSYTVQVTDANSCQAIRTFTITQPTAINIGASQVNVACNGGNTGVLSVSPTGGAGGYTYSWAPSGGTAATATGLAAGTYTVTVTDANTCTRTRSFTVTQPTAISGSTVVTNVACFGGNTGAINLTPSGGEPGYTFNWLPSGPTTEDRTGLVAGTYSVQITDANACTRTVTATVTQPTSPVSGTTVVTNVACSGGNTGAINLTPTGGTGPYTFNWLPSGPTTEDRTGLAAGTYSVQITDANACTGTVTATVTQPLSTISGTTVVTNVACNGGSTGAINLTPTGGTGPYTFNWLPSGPTTEDRTGLAAGTYSVQITDANACTGTVTATVTQPAAAVSGTTVVTNVACNGGSTGAINLTPTGGVGPYTFNWAGGITTEDRTGLIAGSYTVTITDANACTGVVSPTVTQPTAISVTPASQTNVACNGGSNGAAAINTPTGGASGYTYNWTPGNPTGDGTISVTGLTAGSWTVQVTDANSCTASRTFTITQPTAISVTPASQTNVACNGGSNGAAAINTPTGGAGGYTYNWTPGNPTGDGTVSVTGLTAGTWTVQVMDANACTANQTFTVTQPTAISVTPASQTNVACNGGSNGAAAINTPTGGAGGYTYNWTPGNPTGDGTISVTGLTAGTWTVQVTDANACTANQTFTVTQPTAISVTPASQTNVACNGGSNGAAAINTPTGGAGGYTYNWTPGNPTGDGTISVTGLTAGSWTVQVTDANSCTASRTFTITQPTAISVTPASQTNIACNGGSNGAAAINTPTGGAGGYTYNWTPGNPTGDGTVSVTGLTAGTWTVQVTDANACTANQTFTVTQPTALSATVTSTNATCSAADGSASISVSGGAGGYTYSWAPSGGTSASASGLVAGTYTVTVTDANACQITRTVTVGTTINLVVTPSQTNVSCNGGSNGTATVSVTGGSTPYTYSWAPSGGTNATATGLAAGTYTVTITDNVACQTTQTFTLTQPTVIGGTSAITNISCNGGANGAVNFTASGGAGAYTYVWSNGAITEDITGLVAGTYIVTVTDANSCTASFSAAVSQPTVLAPSTSVTNSLCSGLSNGSINLTVTGGTGSYTYLWSNTATTEDISGLADGTYTVIVTDANSCTASASATLQSPIAVSTVATVTNVSCNGGNNGKVVLSSTGGTTPYVYAWSTGAVIDSIVNRTAGTYSYTVTDANGCSVSGSSSITQPAVLAINTTVTANVLCFGGATGAIDATVTGGTTPYTFNWSNGTHNEDLTNASAGSYSLSVVDAKGCQISKGAGTITQPASAVAISIDSTKNINCNGASTGAVYITATGGTSPYTFIWSTGAITEDAVGLAAGTYSVTLTDANGCSTSATATLTQSTVLALDTTVTDILCNGSSTGIINVEVTGGTSPYQYAWSNNSTNEDLVNVAAGTYTLTITDALGCILITGGITVNQNTAFDGNVDSLFDVKCYGGSNGAIYITILGATPPYTYAWSNGATTNNLVNIPAGSYVLTVTDAINCTASTPVITVAQPLAPLSFAVANSTNPGCSGSSNGAIDATVAGGTSPYTYLWSNGNISQDASGLSAGTYTATVTDANGCTAALPSTTLTDPAVLSASATEQNIACNGNSTGAANLTVSGGTTPYTYLWSNGATTEDINSVLAGVYNVTITDANGCSISVVATITQPALLVASAVATDALCNGANGSVNLTVTGGTTPYGYNWSNSTTNEDLVSVAANTYSVTVNDNNGCIATATATVNQPTAIGITATVSAAVCNGEANGEIDATYTGGTGAYTYLWSNGATTEDLTNLLAGSYTVTVTDANSCTATAAYTVSQPAVLTASATASNVSCNSGTNGSIDLTVGGGTAPYLYTWSNTATTQDITGLAAGVYTVTVVDDNSCSVTTSATVTEPAALALSANATNALCNSNANGAVDLTVTGGTAAYTYVWSNAATTQDITGLVAGTYNVTVTDANSCSATLSTTVTEPAVLAATATTTDALCNGANGSVYLTVSGGTAAYTFVWSNTATTEDIADVAGTYTVTVTDVNACTATASATINQPTAISLQVQTTNATCPGAANGAVNLSVSGGTGAYTYIWSNGTTSEDASGLVAGTYTVTVTDANGCTATVSATVTQPAVIAATPTIQGPTCNGTGDGAINVSVTGGTGTYAYAWSDGSTTANLAGISGGSYTLTITDYNLCTAVFGPYVVTEPLPIVAVLDSFDAVDCYGASTGNVYVTIAGGTTPYTFAWSNGASSEDLLGVPAGVYTGTVTDANGCTFTSPQIPVIGPASALATSVSSVVNVSCNGLADGEVMVSATGGTSPYTYAWSNNGTGDMIMGVVADTYTVSVTDANGCSVSVSATVTEPAVLTASATGTDVSCEGGSNGAVTVVTTGGTTPYTPVWSSGTTTGLVAGTYSVTVTDANLCSASSTVTLTFTNTNPVVDLGADVTQCGGTVTIDAGIANANYAWSNGGTAQTTVVGQSAAYSVVVTTIAGCTGTDTVQVTINAIPQVSFNVADTICLNAAAITLTASPTGGTFAGTLVSGDVFTPSTAGEQAISYTYTDANNCSATVSDTISVVVCVGIDEIALATKLNVYPVPNTGSFTVAGSAYVKCELTNNLGQALQYFELNADNNYTYAVQNLSAGVYYVVANNGNASATYKVLVIE